MTPLRVGMIGAGRMANVHAAHLRSLGRAAHIVAASSKSGERAAKLAGEWGGRGYADWRRMLDENKLDAVYICTPTTSHVEPALACVERGLHLFIEKPLALNLADAWRLVQAVEARRLIAVTALHWRYSEGYLRAQELIGGEPVALANMRWYWTRPPIRWMWSKEQAGGQIVDQNIHLVDVSAGLAGEIESVYAAYNYRQVNFEPEFDDWDGYAVTLRYKSGAVGSCAGTYALFPEIQLPPAADLCLRDRLVRVTDKGCTLYTPEGVQEWPNREPFHLGVNRAFVAAVQENNPAYVTTPLRLGLRATAAVLAANASAQSGAPVNLDDFINGFTPGQEQT